jgi:hypothetical protein
MWFITFLKCEVFKVRFIFSCGSNARDWPSVCHGLFLNRKNWTGSELEQSNLFQPFVTNGIPGTVNQPSARPSVLDDSRTKPGSAAGHINSKPVALR